MVEGLALGKGYGLCLKNYFVKIRGLRRHGYSNNHVVKVSEWLWSSIVAVVHLHPLFNNPSRQTRMLTKKSAKS